MPSSYIIVPCLLSILFPFNNIFKSRSTRQCRLSVTERRANLDPANGGHCETLVA
jgi:hypothetical protein